MITKSDVGSFGHSVAHAPRSAYGQSNYSPPPPPLVINYLETQELTYTTYSSTATITEAIGTDAYQLDYAYDTDHHRCHSALKKNGTPLLERWYNGAFERQYDPVNQTTTDICYVDGGDGLTAMIITKSGVTHHYYPYKDQLGSILYLTSNDDHDLSGIQAAQNFDAWGRKRNPETWTYDDVPAVPDWLYRGYTGHEHVEPFVLINMNGRMYDPLNGRMLSADAFVAQGATTGAYNRYTYAANNPLKHVDPDGHLVFAAPLMVSAFIAGYVSGAAIAAVNYSTSVSSSQWSFDGCLRSALLGGFSGAVSATLGAGFGMLGIPALGGLSGPARGILGLGLQAASTTASSALGNIAVGSRWDSNLQIGVGAFSLPFRNGKFSTSTGDHIGNLVSLYHHGASAIDAIAGNAKLGWDWSSMRMTAQLIEGKTGYVHSRLYSDGESYGFHSSGVLYLNTESKLSGVLSSVGLPSPPVGMSAAEKAAYAESWKWSDAVDRATGAGSSRIRAHEGTHALQAGMIGGSLIWSMTWRRADRMYYSTDYLTDPWERIARRAAYQMIIDP